MDLALTESLQKHFGHSAFRPHQREIILSILAGNSTLAILPTGGGKSLTYQLPSLLLDGVTLVISPLLSLIEDQVKELERKNIPCGRYDSTLTPEQRSHQLLLLSQGKTKLFYTSPESLANPRLLSELLLQNISLIAVDEAHCITDWGHSFRPSYLFLPQIIRRLKPHATLALTATATRKSASDIRKLFRIKTAHQFRSSQLRPNLSYTVTPTLSEHKDQHLIQALSAPDRLPAIVYAMRQEQCEAIANTLTQNGFRARSYHAGMHTTARSRVQSEFLADSIDIVVATIAFGMGVDKPNIRAVIHYHLPKSPEGWAQESGRAGRDGAPSHCQILACADDLIPLENFIHTKLVRPQPLRRFIRTLFTQGKSAKISPYHTRVQYDFHVSTLDVLLARLEVAKHIRFTGTSWRYIRAWPVTGKTLDLSGFPKKIQSALLHIFNLGERYDTENTEQDFAVKPTKLWPALELLSQQNDIVFRPSGWFWNYAIKHPDADPSAIADTLDHQLNTHYHSELDKLDHVKKICLSKKCIATNLASWFGEKGFADCQNCSTCHANSHHEKLVRKLPSSPALTNAPTDQQLDTIRAVIKRYPHKLTTNQQLTRFLCGIPSPYIRHHWLNKNLSFGLLSHLPYADVYAYAKATLNAND